MKCLFNGTINDFKIFTDSELKLNKWLIYDQSIDDRYEQVKKYSYIKKLKDLANKNEMEYDKTELISWLDSQKIMLEVIKKINKDKRNILEGIRLIQEFHIPFSRKRADYLIVKDNKILIIEFSYSKLNKTAYQYQTKLNQVINYKELISNVISKNVDIATFTFILHPEEEDKEVNMGEINNFIDYLYYFISDKKYDAYSELIRIGKV